MVSTLASGCSEIPSVHKKKYFRGKIFDVAVFFISGQYYKYYEAIFMPSYRSKEVPVEGIYKNLLSYDGVNTTP